MLALVGDGMVGIPGVAGRFFSVLGRAGVNVIAISQGSSERNISAVVTGDSATRALRAAHGGFYLSHTTLSLGVIGVGNVGAELAGPDGAGRGPTPRKFQPGLPGAGHRKLEPHAPGSAQPRSERLAQGAGKRKRGHGTWSVSART